MDKLREKPEAGYSLLEMFVVIAVIVLLAAIAFVPASRSLRSFRIGGDGRAIATTTSLASRRAVALFTHARLRADISAGTFRVETLRTTGTPGWETEGGIVKLSSGVTFGFGPAGAPPPSSQAIIAQAPQCADDSGSAIPGTACIVFNSRGMPIDPSGGATSNDAIYITDGTETQAVTVMASGLMRLWKWSVGSGAWVRR